MKNKFLVSVVFIVYLSFLSSVRAETVRLNDENDASKILEEVKEAYQSLETYKAHGTIVADTGTEKINTDFNITLKKPNLYLISWSQNIPTGEGWMTQSGAVWSDGTQPYLYMGLTNSYSKEKSDELALAGATGLSGGAAATIPQIFLSVYKKPLSILANFDNPVLKGIEKVKNEECYIIIGSSAISTTVTLWISKSTYLIRKCSRSLGASDELLELLRKTKGSEEDMKRMEDLSKNSKTQYSYIETYEDISSPKLNKEDFQFHLPAGAVLESE